jgi:hypothetical protein
MYSLPFSQYFRTFLFLSLFFSHAASDVYDTPSLLENYQELIHCFNVIARHFNYILMISTNCIEFLFRTKLIYNGRRIVERNGRRIVVRNYPMFVEHMYFREPWSHVSFDIFRSNGMRNDRFQLYHLPEPIPDNREAGYPVPHGAYFSCRVCIIQILCVCVHSVQTLIFSVFISTISSS